MSTANSAGADYTIPPNRPSSGSKNNHGTATRIGTSSSLGNVSTSRDQTDVFGSTVINGTETDPALSGGVFRTNTTRPIGMRLTSMLATNVANTVLLSGADIPGQRRSIHKLESMRTRRIATAIRNNKYDRFTNTFASGFPVVATDALDTDTAATPTRAVPGQLTYKLGQPIPVTNNDYKAKTD